MKKRNIVTVVMTMVLIPVLVVFAIAAFTCTAAPHEEAKGSHEGHDHGKEAKGSHEEADDSEEKDSHEGHDHGKEAKGSHEESDDEGLALSKVQKDEIGLSLKKAAAGNLHSVVMVPGEIALNEDTVVHLVPRTPGIVTAVKKTLGDHVKKGEIVAVLDSAELGEAKSEYFEAFNEVGRSKIDLLRARVVEAGARKLLADLAKLPSMDDLRSKEYGDLGKYRSLLLSSYAEFVLSQKNFERKSKLFREKIASENSFQEAQGSLEKAQAGFYAERDTSTFEMKQNLLERERDQRVKEMKLKTAERKLRILGLSATQITALQATNLATKEDECTDPNCKDPNCKDCQSATEKEGHDHEDHFSQIAIKSPVGGTIIERHIVNGEMATDEENIFTIADLSSVWAHLNVSGRHLGKIKKGDLVTLESSNGIAVDGRVKLVSPIMNEETRTATVRVILDNSTGVWRPGSFITGHISTSTTNLPLVIPKNAVQNIEGKDVVFVPEGHGFKAVPVVTGRSDRKNIEIRAGLTVGTTYVDRGAFDLKAKVITSSLGGHAGHGH